VSPSIDLTDARRVTSALSCSIREGVRVGSSRSMPDSPLAANQRSVASRSAGVVAITSTTGIGCWLCGGVVNERDHTARPVLTTDRVESLGVKDDSHVRGREVVDGGGETASSTEGRGAVDGCGSGVGAFNVVGHVGRLVRVASENEDGRPPAGLGVHYTDEQDWSADKFSFRHLFLRNRGSACWGEVIPLYACRAGRETPGTLLEEHGPRSCNERSRSGVPPRLLRGGGV